MSVFTQKLEKFLGTPWTNEFETTICNKFIQYKSEMTENPAMGQQYISMFIESNQDLLQQCSDEFRRELQLLGEYLTEAEYHGVWEETSIRIHDSLGRKIVPEEVAAIKKVLNNRYGIQIRDREKPTSEIVVMKMPIKFVVSFNKDVKKINDELVVDIVDLNGINLNIAPKVNRIEREKEKQMYASGYIDEQFNKLTETTTADMASFDTPMALIRRPLNYDPYKNAGNVDKKSKTQLKYGFDALKSLSEEINFDKMEVVASNLNEDVEIAKILIREGKTERTVELLKEMVIEYIVDHGHVSDYMSYDGVFDLRRYLKSRPKGIINQIFRECFRSYLKEVDDNAIEVGDIHFGRKIVVFHWAFLDDLAERTSTFKTQEFMNFMQQMDRNFDDHYKTEADPEDPTHIYKFHDWEQYWDIWSWDEKCEWARRFLVTRGVNLNRGLNEANAKSRTDNYSEWKAEVATMTGNDYRIERKSNDSLNTQALDAQGNLVGEWDPNKNLGLIYK